MPAAQALSSVIMCGPFIHRIDPLLADVGGLHLWYYGLSYAVGFLGIHLWFRAVRGRFGLSVSQAWNLSITFAASVLLGGRTVEVLFYEWPYYSAHPGHIPWLWLGGMSTHGILLGAVAGTWLFCRLHRLSFLAVADELVVPGAFLMGIGRLGNFADGLIVGSVTDICWAVKFPEAEGFRHPVVLYDGIKNLLLIPLLLAVRRRARSRPGVVMSHFVLWYGLLRVFVDVFREYSTSFLGIGTGQYFNIFMALLGGACLLRFSRQSTTPAFCAPAPSSGHASVPVWAKQAAFVLILLFSLTLPSDWTQDIPRRYGQRHAGLRNSRLYPALISPAD